MDLQAIPKKPGAYLFKDGRGRVIYVGKAKDLRNRVSSYFAKDAHRDDKVRGIVENHASVEFIVTDSEYEAFLLEANLIKKHRPRYNAILMDDKSYPYILVTKEEFPRAVVVRESRDKGVRFGPFTDVKRVRAALEGLKVAFGVRGCSRRIDGTGRVCLQFHMGRCKGPCAGMVSKQEYAKSVAELVSFIKGGRSDVIQDIEQQMWNASASHQFEKAASLRNRLFGLRRLIDRQRVVSRGRESFDVVGIATAGTKAVAQILCVREGRLEDEKTVSLSHVEGYDASGILEALCSQFYGLSDSLPEMIVVEERPRSPFLSRFLTKRAGRAVEFIVPGYGAKRDLLELAIANAHEKMGSPKAGLARLKDRLGLKKLPSRIECFDISNIGDRWAVGSMVTFRDGMPDKSLYRHFRIKWVEGQNDVAMLAEVVGRRFMHAEWGMPDLVVVDGGALQVSSVARVLRLIKADVPLVGLAKQREELFVPGKTAPIRAPLLDAGLVILRRCRDEAHRFAKAYHSKLRSKSF